MSELSLLKRIDSIAINGVLDVDTYKSLKEGICGLISKLDGDDDWFQMTRSRLEYISSLLDILFLNETGYLFELGFTRDMIHQEIFLIDSDGKLTNYINNK